MAQIALNTEVLEVGLYVVEVIAIVVGLGRVAAHQVVISELSDLSAGRPFGIRRIGPQIDHPGEQREGRPITQAVLVFQETGNAFLIVIGLIYIR